MSSKDTEKKIHMTLGEVCRSRMTNSAMLVLVQLPAGSHGISNIKE
jgi:hypothetical protein